MAKATDSVAFAGNDNEAGVLAVSNANAAVANNGVKMLKAIAIADFSARKDGVVKRCKGCSCFGFS